MAKYGTANKWKRAGFILSFTILPTITFLVFYVYVNFDSVIMAFQQNGHSGFTLNNFGKVFSDLFPLNAEMSEAFKNTFITFGVNMVLFIVGVFVSYFLYKKIFLYKAFRIIFYLPSILSAVVLCSIYYELLQTDAVKTLVQRMFSLDYKPRLFSDEKFANASVIINMIWLTFPGNLIIWGGTFSRVPDGIIESAKIDGVNWVQEAFRIIIPIVWPTFMLMLVLQIAGVFGASGQVFLLTQGMYGTQTISNWMYMQVYNSTNPYASGTLYYVAAMGLMLTVISCAIAILVRKFLTSKIEETTY